MLKNLRLEKILSLVDKNGYASLHELMNATSSSESTIRADLVFLEKENKLVRLHGGAESLKKSTSTLEELAMDEKFHINVDKKMKVAQKAASLIKDNTIIYIDAGTTTSYICDYLETNGNLIVTNSMTIAQKLTKKNFKVYVTGGEIKLTTDAFVGSFPLETINKFTFDVGFFGTNGISLEQGFTTPDYEEAIVKQTALNRSKKAFILADSSKLDLESGVSFSPFEKATLIIDRITKKEYKKGNVIEVK